MTKSKKKGAKPKTRTRASRTGKQPISRSLGMTDRVHMLAKAIHDPCGGPLVGSVDNVGSASIVERVRRTFDIVPGGGTDVHGYIVWYPGYHGGGSYGGAGNLFQWASSSFTARPTNNVTTPAGTGALNTTGTFHSDPCYANLTSDTFSRARSVSACMQFDYVGALSAMQGQIAIVKNFSLQAFDQAAALGALSFPSVSEIFNFAQTRQRVTGEGVEVVWRPSSNGSIMRGHGHIAPTTGQAAMPDHVFTIGHPTFVTTSVSCPEVGVPNGICIAWTGISGTNNFILSCIKTVELELAARNNAIEAPLSTSVPRTPGLIEKATAILDNAVPGWQARTVHAAMRGAATLLERAYGPRNRTLLRAPNAVGLIRDRDL